MSLLHCRSLRIVGHLAARALGPGMSLLAGAVHGVATGVTLASAMANRGVSNGACPEVSCLDTGGRLGGGR
ncbi:MAG: hypothetical protein Q8P41_27965 [Pseudomonadota bacterium]|nr:hypothetical protein [Pseudomonadota bacterium]